MPDQRFGRFQSDEDAIADSIESHGAMESMGKKGIGPILRDEMHAALSVKEGKIDEGAWQREVDEYFQAGNYAAIETLQKIRPTIQPSPGLVTERLNRLVEERPQGWNLTFECIRRISKAIAGQETVTSVFRKLLIEFEARNLNSLSTELHKLVSVTGYKPTAQEVRQTYLRLLEDNYLRDEAIHYLSFATGIKPDNSLIEAVLKEGGLAKATKAAEILGLEVTEQMKTSAQKAIDETCMRALDSGKFLDRYYLREHGMTPSSHVLQRSYRILMAKENQTREFRDDLNYLIETGIRPSLSQAEVDALCKDYAARRCLGDENHFGIQHIVNLSGMCPSSEASCEMALELIDNIMDNGGPDIRQTVNRLSTVLGYPVAIPPEKIQDRYRRAMTQKRPSKIIELFRAFHITLHMLPEARAFLASCLDNYAFNEFASFSVLEEVFGVQFKATPLELAGAYDKAIESLDTGKLKRIQRMTGENIPANLKEKFFNTIEREFFREQPYGRHYNFLHNVKSLLGQMYIEVDDTIVHNWFARCVTTEGVDFEKAKEIFSLFGKKMPEEIAQKAYGIVFARSELFYDAADKLDTLYAISGQTRPLFAAEIIHAFYTRCLYKCPYDKERIDSIRTVTGVEPKFGADELKEVCLKKIRSGWVDAIPTLSKSLNIALDIDEDVTRAASERLTALLEDYLARAEEFRPDDSRLNEVERILTIIPVAANGDSLQRMYDRLFSEGGKWQAMEKIAISTGITPRFPQAKIQEKIPQLQRIGDVCGLQALRLYGSVTLDPDLVPATYDATLAGVQCKDRYGELKFRSGWMDDLHALCEMSGIRPSDAQMEMICRHYEASHYCANKEERAIAMFDALSQAFDVAPTEAVVRSICSICLIADNDLRSIKKWSEKTKIKPVATQEALQATVAYMFQYWHIDSLEELKNIFGLKQLPFDSGKVQEMYTRLASNKDFGTVSAQSTKQFFSLHTISHIPPHVSQDDASAIYRKSTVEIWSKLFDVLQMHPLPDDAQHKYFQILCHSTRSSMQEIDVVRSCTNCEITEKTALSAMEYFAEKGDRRGIDLVVRQTKVSPHLSPEAGDACYRILLQKEFPPCSSELARSIDYLDKQGIHPSKTVLLEYYSKLFALRDSYSDGNHGAEVYWGDTLAKKFGKPDAAMTQQIYSSHLESGWEALEYIQKLTGIRPVLSQMTAAENGSNIDSIKRLDNALLQQLIQGDIHALEKMEIQFGVILKIDPANAQILFAQFLLEPCGNLSEMYNFLVRRSHSLPSREIIDARYHELLAPNRSADDILIFHEIVNVTPPEALLQEKYRELFSSYVHTSDREYDEDNGEYEHDNSSGFLSVIDRLEEAMEIPPNFTKEYAMECFAFCITHDDSYYQKIPEIERATGFCMDREFIQIHLLDRKEIASRVPVTIEAKQLDEHFAKPENATVTEYQRIYTVFGCFDYYKTILAQLEQDQTPDAIRQRIGILGAMGLRDMEDDERYQKIKEKLFACAEGQGRTVRKYLADALAELARNGDNALIAQFADIIRKRSRGQLAEAERSTAGFIQEEELALRTLMRLDNTTANEALLCLLTAGNVEERVKRLVLDNLLKKGDFFPHHMREKLTDYSRMTSAFQWNDLQCFQAIRGIASTDLRHKSITHFDNAMGRLPHHGGIQAMHQEFAPAVPDNAFMQLWEFTGGDEELLKKFNQLYEKTKSASQRDAILFGVVNAAGVQKEVMQKVRACLRTLDIAADPQAVAGLLKTISFLDTVQRRIQRRTREEGETDEGSADGETRTEKLSVFAALDQPLGSVVELNQALRVIVVESIKQVLPNDAIDADKIQTLWEEWGNLEPIFVYAGKMAEHKGTRRLVAEMVANMDPPTYAGWKKWRYNLDNEVTKAQVGHLSAEQLERWKTDHFSELGDIMIATSPTDRSKQVSSVLEGAVSDGHIFNATMEGTSTKHQALQERIATIYTTFRDKPEARTGIINTEIQSLQEDMKRMDVVKNHLELSKPLDSYARIQAGKGKEKDIEFIASSLLSGTEQTEIGRVFEVVKQEAQQAVTGKEKVNFGEVMKQRFSDIFTPSIQEAIKRKMQESEAACVHTLSESFCARLGIDLSQFDTKGMKSVGTVYQKLKEMKTLVDLLRLSVLTQKLIATNRISEKENKKTGETLSKVLESLREYFKDTPAFVQDLENIQSTVTQKEELGSNRRLAMIVTDNPQIMFQVGKYPLGCGSCQNYEGDPGYNKSLAGYVSDAHTKAIFLIDLQKLPKDVLEEVEQKGFEAIKDNIHPQDLLEASIARSMAKLVRFQGKESVVFLEPTYSSVNKGDLGMDKYFNIFAELMVSDPMGIRLVRGDGNASVQVPDSRNPSGQYEDCAAGNAGHAGMGIQQGSYTMPARFINKFSPVTDADKKLAARISSDNPDRHHRRAG